MFKCECWAVGDLLLPPGGTRVPEQWPWDVLGGILWLFACRGHSCANRGATFSQGNYSITHMALFPSQHPTWQPAWQSTHSARQTAWQSTHSPPTAPPTSHLPAHSTAHLTIYTFPLWPSQHCAQQPPWQPTLQLIQQPTQQSTRFPRQRTLQPTLQSTHSALQLLWSL